ncbi:hypothetical protein M430DRAFT_43791 [Amorphotheca resinae ATCC 22711]|uniref:Uncharacterized protein n=1 Tax=Amorphotheca resinae ATCC 22711 TaxID=857342 RepID=A0A2T3AWC4_AMORE|nr:hypothetical protein M430DRAFT_43791 [Amorphotheca resinae ATCC 22711]PSS12968.1 hypothetical protein M430DRAFT_43791 [Amorphotheca resinae ATCC 22711]
MCIYGTSTYLSRGSGALVSTAGYRVGKLGMHERTQRRRSDDSQAADSLTLMVTSGSDTLIMCDLRALFDSRFARVTYVLQDKWSSSGQSGSWNQRGEPGRGKGVLDLQEPPTAREEIGKMSNCQSIHTVHTHTDPHSLQDIYTCGNVASSAQGLITSAHRADEAMSSERFRPQATKSLRLRLAAADAMAGLQRVGNFCSTDVVGHVSHRLTRGHTRDQHPNSVTVDSGVETEAYGTGKGDGQAWTLEASIV